MRARLDGTELYFDVEGAELRVEGDRLCRRPTMIVLHGGPGFDQGYLRPGLSPLADDAQLVFVDLRGQGRSAPAPLEACTLEQMADDVAALCDLLGIERPFVFGHSAGGFVALHLALRHPDLPGGLILCDSAPTLAPLPDDNPPPGLAERAGDEAVAVAERLFAGDFSPETNEAFGRLVAPHYAAPEHPDIPGRLLTLSRLDTDLAGYFFSTLAPHYDLRARLAEITAPTLVLVGSYDWVCPPAASRALAHGLPHARLVELPRAGHFGFTETPGPFLEAVRAHIDEVFSRLVSVACEEESMSVSREGGCSCGAIRYRLASDPLFIHCCHCLNCQRQTGSAFVVNLLIESDRVEQLAGAPQPVDVPRDDGSTQRIFRCPTCQVAVFSHYGNPRVSFVRGGTLDDPSRVKPDVHIYTRSKVSWVTLPESVPAFDVYYDSKTLWPAASLERLRAIISPATSDA